jgi:hypothetical protein
MSSFLKYATASCLFLTLAGGDILKAVPPGFVEGRLKILSVKEVGAQLAEPGSNQPAGDYQAYPLVILSQDRRREIALITPNADGTYRVALPPGVYILDVKDRLEKNLKAEPHSFTVESNQTVQVIMLISR